MTVIIALKDEKNKKIYLGADRQWTGGDMSYRNFGCKLLKVEIPIDNDSIDEMYIAFSGSAFLHQYLLNVFQAPVWDADYSFINYLYNQYFFELKQQLLEQQLIKKDKELLDSEAGLILIHDENLYEVYYDLSIVESPRKYVVSGAGYKIATAIIENDLKFHQDMDYKKIVEEALYTTGELNIYCNTDYDILTIDY